MRVKDDVWSKKETGETDDAKCHLSCFQNFHGLLGNSSSSVWMYVASCLQAGWERGGGKKWFLPGLIKVKITN